MSRKVPAAILAHRENRDDPAIGADLARADGHAERQAALASAQGHARGSARRRPLGAIKDHDRAAFVIDPGRTRFTPQVAQKARDSAIDGRIARHERRGLSRQYRRRIEDPCARAKAVSGMVQTVCRGVGRARVTLVMAAGDLAGP